MYHDGSKNVATSKRTCHVDSNHSQKEVRSRSRSCAEVNAEMRRAILRLVETLLIKMLCIVNT